VLFFIVNNYVQIALARAANSQTPSDHLAGAEPTGRPQSRGGFAYSTRIPSGETHRDKPPNDTDYDYEKHRREVDELRAEVKTLKYTIDNHKQEEEVLKLRHESEVRESRRKAEDDFKKMQAAEAEKSKALRQNETLLKDLAEARDTASREKIALERRIREAEEGRRALEEEIEDIKSEREESVRSIERKSTELESRTGSLQRSLEELQQESERKDVLLSETQQQLTEKNTAYGALEAEVLRLKAQTGDAVTLGVIKRELSEQVTHIKKLESANREQFTELKHLKSLHKSIEVVEEEKRSLQRKLDGMEELQNKLGEAQIQRQRLEDERLAWTAYLQNQTGSDGQVEFDSPEALARALIEERFQRATLVERLGALEAELSEKDSIVSSLEQEKSTLTEELKASKSAESGPGVDSQALLRLERQRALAIKEVEYLREQLKAFDTEDTTFQPESVDEAKVKRIQELEDIVDQYRHEVENLHVELTSREATKPATETVGSKRPREEAEDSERLGQLSRKTRKLQDELSTAQTNSKILEKELAVTKERLTAATKQSKTRILSLRSNPTSDFEAIKTATLNSLRKENADLLAQLRSGLASTDSVPLSSLEVAEREVKQAEEAVKSEKKMNDRLKKVWHAKTQEFRELVVSLLGWDVVFLSNGKMRVTSYFYPSKGDHENSIEFDGDKGTMKVSGGPQSAFAMKIKEQIKFWVHGKGSVPCFLAALTLEFYEEANKDGTLRVDV
jgi:mitotic spindle assembly checkpoint protein MAD1